MLRVTRRAFVRLFAAGTALLLVPRRIWSRVRGELDASMLAALGEALLPGELGAEGQHQVAEEFGRWVREYRPNAELSHPYGSAELRWAPEDPTPRWAAQLTALERGAHDRYGAPFVELSSDRRRELVRDQIGTEGTDGFPSVARSRHVAVAFLAFFYESPEATNLAHGVAIDPMSCRDLAQAPEIPPPLEIRR
jgi:hypothetical protein